MKITIKYFAALRDARGLAEESLEFEALSGAALYERLQARYGFPLPLAHIRLAVNECFVPSQTMLAPGDVVAFIPPVSGG